LGAVLAAVCLQELLTFAENQFSGFEVQLRELGGSPKYGTIANLETAGHKKGFHSTFLAPVDFLNRRAGFLDSADGQLPDTRLSELEDVCNMQDRSPLL